MVCAAGREAMRFRVSYRRALLLGALGSILPWAYPFLFNWISNVYWRAASGQLGAEVYGAVFQGFRSLIVGDLGLLMAPMGFAVFFRALWKETRAPAVRRQVASGIAAVLMLVAAAAFVWRESFYGGIVPTGEDPLLYKAWLIGNLALLIGWSLLQSLFALWRQPLRRAVLPLVAVSVAALTASVAGITIYDVWLKRGYLSLRDRFHQPAFLAAEALQLAGWAAVIVFLAVLRREARLHSREA